MLSAADLGTRVTSEEDKGGWVGEMERERETTAKDVGTTLHATGLPPFWLAPSPRIRVVAAIACLVQPKVRGTNRTERGTRDLALHTACTRVFYISKCPRRPSSPRRPLPSKEIRYEAFKSSRSHPIQIKPRLHLFLCRKGDVPIMKKTCNHIWQCLPAASACSDP